MAAGDDALTMWKIAKYIFQRRSELTEARKRIDCFPGEGDSEKLRLWISDSIEPFMAFAKTTEFSIDDSAVNVARLITKNPEVWSVVYQLLLFTSQNGRVKICGDGIETTQVAMSVARDISAENWGLVLTCIQALIAFVKFLISLKKGEK